MGEQITWDEMTLNIGAMKKALDVLEAKYHKAIAEHRDSIPIEDITDVMQASTYYKEIDLIGGTK